MANEFVVKNGLVSPNVQLQGSTSGTVTIVAPAIAGTPTITLPTTAGTIVTTGDTGTVTNTMLAGSIANTKLVNSAVTVGTTSISLGASSTTLAGLTSVTSTSFVGALTGNASTATALATGRTIALTGDVTYTSGSFDGSANVTGTATLATVNANTGTYTKVTVNGKGLVTAASNASTSDISEGTNLYYTDTRARAAYSFTPGSGAYNSTTGVITIPTNTNQLTNGAGFITSNQSISVTGDATGSGTTSIALILANSGATAGTYNNVTVNAKGLVTSGSNVSYLTSYTETDTLATVTARGASTSTAVTLNGGLTMGAIVTGYAGNTMQVTGNMGLYASSNYYIRTGTTASYTEAIWIPSNGNVHIGTAGTDSGYKLYVSGGAVATQNIGSTSGTPLALATAGNVGTWIGGISDGTSGWSLSQATIGFKSDNNTYAAIGIATAGGLLYFGRTTASGVGTMSSWLEVDSGGVANFKRARPQHNGSNLALVSEIPSTSSFLSTSGGTLTGNLTAAAGQGGISITSTINAAGGSNISIGRAASTNQAFITFVSDTLYMGVLPSVTSGTIGSATGALNFAAGGYTTQASLATDGTFSSTNLKVGSNQVLHAGNYTNYSFTSSDTLGTVTGRGASTSTNIQVNSLTIGNNAYIPDSSYNGLRHSSMTGNAYMIISANANTFISAASGAAVTIRPNANDSANELVVNTGANGLTFRGNTVLHAGNYTSYSPSLTGSGASGTWGINVTGSAGSTGYSNYLYSQDIRTLSPSSTSAYRLGFGFTSWANNNTASYADYLALRSYSDSSGGNDNLLMFNKSSIAMRLWQQSFGSTSAYSSYADVLMSNNYSSYAIPLSGGTMTGALTINANDGVSAIYSGTDGQTWLRGWGLESNRASTYFRPLNNNTQTLQIGYSAGSQNWNTINLDGTNVYKSGNVVLHAGNYSSYALPLSGGTLSGAIIVNAGSGYPIQATSSQRYQFHITNTSATAQTQGWWLGHDTGGNLFFHADSTGDKASIAASGFGFQIGTASTYDNPGGWGANLVASGTYHARVRLKATSYNSSGDQETYMWLDNSVSPTTGIYSSKSTFNFNGSISTVQIAGNTALHASNYTSYAPSLTGGGASGTWGINISGSLTASAPQLASATESNSIYVQAPSYTTDKPVKVLQFDWYGNTWGIGNIRSGATPSSGLGIFYGSSNTEVARFTTSSLIVSGSGNFNGITINQERSNNARIYSATTGSMGLVGMDSGGTFKWQIYGDGTSYGFLDSTWGNWDIRKAINGTMELRVSGTNQTVLHTGNYSSYALPLSGATMTGAITTPAGTSIYIGNQNVSTSSRLVINWHTDSDYNYLIGKRAGAWTQPLDITFYTGIRYHAHNAYGGHKFYSGGYDGAMSFSIGDGDNNVRVTNTLYIGGNTALHAGNYSSYALPLSGGTVSGAILIGPNSNGQYTRIGGNGGATDHATLSASNGNLHIDSKAGYDLYLNYYTGRTIYGPGGATVFHSGNYKASSAFHQRIHYGTTAGNSGYYKISILPATSWMLAFTIRMYQGYTSYDIRISGYNYGGNYWYSPEASLMDSSTTSIDVRFGYDSAYNLWVAVPAGAYTGLDILDVVNGYTQVDGNYADQFSIVNQGTLTGTVQTVVTAYRPWKYNETVTNAGSCSGNAATATRAAGNFYIDSNYGRGIVGVYSSYRYQGVFAMGDSYKLADDGTSTGSLYGMAWSHPNTGGIAGNLSSHGLLLLQGGGFMCALSTSIVAAANITAYSDERLKTNWRDMPEDYVARLAQVKVGIYDRTDQEDVTQVGVSAQSFQKLLPQAIMTAKDEMQTLSVNYGGAALASAVELAKDNMELRSRIEKLEALVFSLLNKE